MNLKNAKNFIINTFKAKFDKEKFRNFATNLLDEIDESLPAEKVNIEDFFQNVICSVEVIGRYCDENRKIIDVLSVQIKDDCKLDNISLILRKFLTIFLKNRQMNYAIAALYQNSNPNWNLSFVKLNISKQYNDGENPENEFFTVKRSTFLVGEFEPSYVIQSKLSKLLTKKHPSIEKIEEAFDANDVSNNFLESYKELFFQLMEILQKNGTEQNVDNLTIEDYCKNILSKLLFIYFLQKKVNCNSDKFEEPFLHNIFDVILERFDDYVNSDKKGLIGDGILDVFNRYNFTIKENDPLDKLMAITPDILGKVFEGMLNIQDRKSNGTFYTPVEIVRYMCQNSLLNYLDAKLNEKEYTLSKQDLENFIYNCDKLTYKKDVWDKSNLFENIKINAKIIDKLLENIKICDPAVGSGVYLVGMLEEIVKIRTNLIKYGFIEKNENKLSYEYKKHTIENSIYGVDIDSEVVNIVKYRLWLSLISEDYDIDISNIVPNIDYKIFCDNLLTKTNQSLSIDTNFSNIFKENKGFDVVIGNPPYISYKKISKIYNLSNFNSFYNNQVNKPNLYVYFIEQALNTLLNKNGIMCFITPISFLVQSDCIALRKFILQKKIIEILDLSYIEIFDKAQTYTGIISIQNSNIIGDFLYRKYFEMDELDKKPKIKLSLDMAKTDNEYKIILSENIELVKKIKQQSLTLADYTNVTCGTSKNGFSKEISTLKTKTNKLVLQTSDIMRYKIIWQGKYIDTNLFPKGKIKKYFDAPKIVMARMTDRIRCALDLNGYFCAKVNVIISKSNNETMLKNILGILNSNLINYYYRETYDSEHKRGAVLGFETPSVEKIPIPFINEDFDKISTIVDKIYQLSTNLGNIDTPQNADNLQKEYENKINLIVYKLYNLTYKEVKIIDKDFEITEIEYNEYEI